MCYLSEVGIEPTIFTLNFSLEGWRVIHCATRTRTLQYSHQKDEISISEKKLLYEYLVPPQTIKNLEMIRCMSLYYTC